MIQPQPMIAVADVDLDGILRRVRESRPVVLDGPLVNPNSGQREIWVSGPEGYVVVASGPCPRRRCPCGHSASRYPDEWASQR